MHIAAAHAGSAAGSALRALLAAGGDLEAAGAGRATPLLVALAENRREAVDILLAAGAAHWRLEPTCLMSIYAERCCLMEWEGASYHGGRACKGRAAAGSAGGGVRLGDVSDGLTKKPGL